MEEQLISIKNNAMSLLLDVTDPTELEGIKLQFLGKSGILTMFLKEVAKLPMEERPRMGKLANETKNIIEDALLQKQIELKDIIQDVQKQTIDVTNPGIKPNLGHLHLITQAIEEITDIFERIGFTKVKYPEVEWDYYAFTALNFPENHPARDDWETFFTTEEQHPDKGQIILTPHTSSGQVREIEKAVAENKKTGQPIDIKMLNIAKCYRRQSDISHTQMFHQFEGLVVGENISITHLKGVLDYFVKSYFGEKRISRIRPYHFQFTEPSFEVDVSCGVCDGTGKINGENCRLCKAGWLEMGGSGMVHPNVLKYGGIDPEKYTGFAFGWGVERVLMMKEGIEIDDLRLLYSNKLEFLEQF